MALMAEEATLKPYDCEEKNNLIKLGRKLEPSKFDFKDDKELEPSKSDLEYHIKLQPSEFDFEYHIRVGYGDEPYPIVLFGECKGEGSFTFSIALASLRTNGSEGITATALDAQLPAFSTAQATAVRYCVHNGQKQGLSGPAIQNNIAQVSGVPDFSNNWHTGVDPTNIRVPYWLQVAGKVVWFQCPWRSGSTADLVLDFIREMARNQNVGDILVIGITTHPRYFGAYNIERLLGDGPESAIKNGYRYLGHDENIIKKILARGYKHEGYIDIHDFIIDTHSTLVFKRKDDDPVKDWI